ncbi:hypothetical protein Y032_0115g500 [Ancylostoma ceylanicum]|uniref:Uncharacterized protein n=1 Tax=Ancylostoma ceylanicum TaxID=53326 RepID=A0A016TCU2_9BILA|nr:hypothetical protein Y032_0115g500 [Ancylostoma ceylanicum]
MLLPCDVRKPVFAPHLCVRTLAENAALHSHFTENTKHSNECCAMGKPNEENRNRVEENDETAYNSSNKRIFAASRECERKNRNDYTQLFSRVPCSQTMWRNEGEKEPRKEPGHIPEALSEFCFFTCCQDWCCAWLTSSPTASATAAAAAAVYLYMRMGVAATKDVMQGGSKKSRK